MLKTYLALTGTLFGIFGGFHVWATVAALDRLHSEPGLVFGRAAIAGCAVALSIWAWWLFLRSRPA